MSFDRFLALLRALAAEEVDYVLVGAVAMSLHGIVRATEDIDLFVRSTEENVARLRRALTRVWKDPEIDEITAEDLAGDYPIIRYGPPGGTFVVDLLSRLGTAVAYDDLEAETIELEGVVVRLATPETLYEMKRDTVRPSDAADASALRQRFDLEQEDS